METTIDHLVGDNMEIIAHRGMLNNDNFSLENLQFIYDFGITSFEFDIFDFANIGISIGHPLDVKHSYFKPHDIGKLLEWSVGKTIKFYFDIKYPNQWNLHLSVFLDKLSFLDKNNVILISYDSKVFTNIARKMGFKVVLIVDKMPHKCPECLLVPISEIIEIKFHKNIVELIATGVNDISQLETVEHHSIKRIMTDYPLLIKKEVDIRWKI